MLVLLWCDLKGFILKYDTSHRLRQIVFNDWPKWEEGRNAISSELIMNHTALAIICLHIIGLVMWWWEIFFQCLVQTYMKSNFIEKAARLPCWKGHCVSYYSVFFVLTSPKFHFVFVTIL